MQARLERLTRAPEGAAEYPALSGTVGPGVGR